MKAFKLAGAVVAAIVLLAIIALTVGIPSSIVNSSIQARVERATGYHVVINGSTRIGFWPAFQVTLNDISLSKAAGSEGDERMDIASARIELPLGSVLSGTPNITSLAIEKPVAYLPLLRERTPSIRTPTERNDSAAPVSAEMTLPSINRITVTDGTLVFSNQRDKVENRIGAINGNATIGEDRQITMSGTAQSGAHALKLELRAAVPDGTATRRNVPVELTFEAPSLLPEKLTAKADVRIAGTMLRINSVAGTLGGKPFTGWASVDLASKPLVKVDLDMQDLAIGTASSRAAGSAPAASSAPWSDAPLDVSGLNYIDADIRVSAAQLALGELRIAPAALSATLARGSLNVKFENLGLYDGTAHGELTLDASAATPTYRIQGDIEGVRALPMLSGLADFDKLEGKLQAKFAVQTAGRNQRALMSGLDGTAFANFRDGKIRDLNVAQMIRSLTSGTLSGWQAEATQATDLSQLSASFRITQGKAVTSDLALVGPLVRMSGTGTIDLAAKSLALRVEPKLVMTLEGQGSATDPIGLGIPVAIDGPWASPRIYPDVAGILDNPDAAYARLRQLGEGLFGANDAGSPSKNGGSLDETLGETLGGMIRQGLGGARQPPAVSPDTPGQPQNPDGASPIDGILKQLFSR